MKLLTIGIILIIIVIFYFTYFKNSIQEGYSSFCSNINANKYNWRSTSQVIPDSYCESACNNQPRAGLCESGPGTGEPCDPAAPLYCKIYTPLPTITPDTPATPSGTPSTPADKPSGTPSTPADKPSGTPSTPSDTPSGKSGTQKKADDASDPVGYFKAEAIGKDNVPLDEILYHKSPSVSIPWNEIWIPPPPQKPETQAVDASTVTVELKKGPIQSPYYNENLYFKLAQADVDVKRLEGEVEKASDEIKSLEKLRAASEKLLQQQKNAQQDRHAQIMQNYIGQVMNSDGEDLYILKSQIVPPNCPACPTQIGCADTSGKCPSCPSCPRCLDPDECETILDYQISGIGEPRAYDY